MAYNKDVPYNDLPLLPPSKEKWETLGIYKKLADARAKLAELKGRLPVMPNPMMLINTLVLQEAKDSSTIENIFTTNDKLYKAFSSNATNTDPATKEILRYREAMWNAFPRLQTPGNFSKDLIVDIFRTITLRDEEVREKQVYLKSGSFTVYTPPEYGNVLSEKLNNWLDFAHSQNNIDPLIKMAILHYQFEAMHPFSDGNGRSGRILNILYLCLEKLIDQPVLYLSSYILATKNDYNRLLLEVTEKEAWENWILYLLEGIKITATLTLKKVNLIYSKFNEILEKVKKEAPNIYKYELIEAIFTETYCKIGLLEDKKIASRNTASKYLKNLEELGILKSEIVGRETLYLNMGLYDILTNN